MCGCGSDADQQCPNGCEYRTEFKALITRLSVRHGSFLMAGGQTSDLMIDLSTTLRTARGQELLGLCSEGIFTPGTILGGPCIGSDLVCCALTRTGQIDRWFGIRKEAKGRGLDRHEITGNLQDGDRVWLVEDVCTTGKSLTRCLNALAHVHVVGAFAVVDRGGLSVMAERGFTTCSLFKEGDFREP